MSSENDADELSPYNLFTLTDLISKKATQARRVVVLTTEIYLATAVWYGVSLALCILVAILLGIMFMGPYAALFPIFVPLIVTAVATTRSRTGLQLTHMSRFMDKLDRPWAKGLLVYTGRLYDPMEVRVVTVTPASVEVAALPDFTPVEGSGITGVDEVTDAREQQVLAAGGSSMMVPSARGDAAQQSLVRASMMDVTNEEDYLQWARSWEAHVRLRREEMLEEFAQANDEPMEGSILEEEPDWEEAVSR